jgi:phosphoserine aminotransferase
MEDNEEVDEQELSEIIEYLIEMGAMEIMGYDSISDQFTYKVTPKCKEIYPELYYAHYEAVGELAASLWMQDVIDIVFTEGETIVGVTPEQIEFIKETINTFTDDERFFLETILSHYDQK